MGYSPGVVYFRKKTYVCTRKHEMVSIKDAFFSSSLYSLAFPSQDYCFNIPYTHLALLIFPVFRVWVQYWPRGLGFLQEYDSVTARNTERPKGVCVCAEGTTNSVCRD